MTASELTRFRAQVSAEALLIEMNIPHFSNSHEQDTIRDGIMIWLAGLSDRGILSTAQENFFLQHAPNFRFEWVVQLEEIGDALMSNTYCEQGRSLMGYIIMQYFRRHTDVREVCERFVIEVSNFLRKLRFNREDLADDTCHGAIVRLTERWEETPWRLNYGRRLNLMLKSTNLCPNWEDFHFSHGPGAIRSHPIYPPGNRNNAFQKTMAVGYNERLYHWYRYRNLYSPYDLLSQICNTVFRYPFVDGVSKLCPVPKTRKKLRVIADEESIFQLTQQGIRRMLYAAIDRNPFWSKRFHLHDPRTVARRALRDPRYATIDLSAASDSVRLKMVKTIFRGTQWLDGLLASRSSKVEYKHHRYTLTTYATMGNATTFPVEGIIFLLIAQSATDDTELVTGDRLLQPFVYGDDIIIDVRAYKLCIDYLTLYGFHINEDKSYSSPHFREACGIHQYENVGQFSPLYFREAIKYFEWQDKSGAKRVGIHPDSISALVALFSSGQHMEVVFTASATLH
jgi:hypothetical protein